MALLTKSGILTVPTLTGNQSITGLGFQPKFILFFGNNYQRSDPTPGLPFPDAGDLITTHADSGILFGCGISSSDNIVQSFSAENNADIPTAYVSRATNKCIRIISNPPSSVVGEASIVSMDADGFTLNWSIVDTIWIRDISYLAFGGDTISNIKSGSSTTPLTISTKSITGLGFKPDLLILFAFSAAINEQGSGTSNVSGSIGFTSGISESYVGFRIRNNITTTLSKTKLVTDKCFGHISDSGNFSEASFYSFDSGGFTLNWETVSGTADYFYYIAIKGGSFKIGSFLQPIVTGIQNITSLGSVPKATLLLSDNKVSSSNVTDHARLTVGFGVSSADSQSFWMGNRNNLNTSIAYSDYDPYPSFKLMTELSTTGSSLNAYGRYSTASGGFKINWTTVDSTQRNIFYVAFSESVLADSYKSFVLHGYSSLIKLSKYIFHGKQSTTTFNKYIFHGKTASIKTNKYVFHGKIDTNKFKPFIFTGTIATFVLKPFVFHGIGTVNSFSKFIFDAKLVLDFLKPFIWHGKQENIKIKTFVFHGINTTNKLFRFIFEGTSLEAGNWALFRVNLSGLPTTAQVTGARLVLTVGKTSGSYQHELWTLNSTGRAWSDTAATWNYANGLLAWTNDLGDSYKGGYADREYLVSKNGNFSDEERISFNLNSTGLSYIQNNTGGQIEFILLSDYTGTDYAQYRSVEDITVNKRPVFYVDYLITAPTLSSENRFIFHGIDISNKIQPFIFHGKNSTSLYKPFIIHGKESYSIFRNFVFAGISTTANIARYLLHGKNLASKYIPFIFDGLEGFSGTFSFVFQGIYLATNFFRYIFTGSEYKDYLSKFVFNGKRLNIELFDFQFHGIDINNYISRFCFDAGYFNANKFPFVFEGKPSAQRGYTIKDAKKISILDKNRGGITDANKNIIKPYIGEHIDQTTRKNIVIK